MSLGFIAVSAPTRSANVSPQQWGRATAVVRRPFWQPAGMFSGVEAALKAATVPARWKSNPAWRRFDLAPLSSIATVALDNNSARAVPRSTRAPMLSFRHVLRAAAGVGGAGRGAGP